ncbi:MAG: hypothetical protein HYW49_00105 [Deltaproteobacteria bacterium]|nr:hypothetical protein [Deltaproteobacteria bacterium]
MNIAWRAGLALMVLATAAAAAAVLAQSASAAQNAVVTVTRADLHASPDPESEVLESRFSGARLRVSNFHKNGWYRVRATNGRYGWIWQADIAVDFDQAPLASASIDLAGTARDRKPRESHWLFLTPRVVALGLSSINVGGFRGNYTASMGFLFDLAVQLDTMIKAVARTGYYSGSLGGEIFSASRSGLLLLGGAEFELSRRPHWHTGINLLAGIDSNSITLEAAAAANPSTVSASESSLLGMLSYVAKYTLNPKTRFALEFGAYFEQSKSRTLEKVAFMQRAGNPSSLTPRFMGPFVSFGVEFAL